MTTAGQPGEAKMEREPFTGPFTRKGNRLYRGDGQQMAVVMSAAEGDWILSRLSAPVASPLPEGKRTPLIQGIIDQARAVMRRDDACDILQPSDIRVLIGEIDRLSATPPGAAGQAVDWQKAAEEILDQTGVDEEHRSEAVSEVAAIIACHAAPLPGYAALSGDERRDLAAIANRLEAVVASTNGQFVALNHERQNRRLLALFRRLTAAPLPEQAAVEKMARAIYEASPSSRKQNGDLRLTWENMLPQFPEACEMWRTVARAAYAALHGEG